MVPIVPIFRKSATKIPEAERAVHLSLRVRFRDKNGSKKSKKLELRDGNR